MTVMLWGLAACGEGAEQRRPSAPVVLFPVNGSAVVNEPGPRPAGVYVITTAVSTTTQCYSVDGEAPACQASADAIALQGLPNGVHTLTVQACHFSNAMWTCSFQSAPVTFSVQGDRAWSGRFLGDVPCTVNPQGLWCTGAHRIVSGGDPTFGIRALRAWLALRYTGMSFHAAAREQTADGLGVGFTFMLLARAYQSLARHEDALLAAQHCMVWAAPVFSQHGDPPFQRAAAAVGMPAGSGKFMVDFVSPAQWARHSIHAAREGEPQPPRRAPAVARSQSPKPSIGIVTLCDYDPNVTPLASLSIANKKTYAARHGYGLHVHTKRLDTTRPPAWSKVPAVRAAVEAGKYDWVFWLDCDSFVMQQEEGLERLLPESDTATLVLSEDGTLTNSGVFGIRVGALGLELLYTWYGDEGEPSPFVDHPWWEQAALHALVTGMSARTGLGVVPNADPGRDWPRRVHWVPQSWLNSYPALLASQLRDPVTGDALHASYLPGDFILSFSGCRVFGTPDECNRMYTEAAAAAVP